MTTMQKMLKNKQIKISGVIMVMISLLSVYGSFSPVLSVNYAQAETNLILDGSFEDVIDKNWFVWKDSASLRDYSVFRSLSVPFGTGSYSAGLEATGEAESRWQAGIVTKSKFKVELSSN